MTVRDLEKNVKTLTAYVMDDWALDRITRGSAERLRVEDLVATALRAAYVIGNWESGKIVAADEGTINTIWEASRFYGTQKDRN